MHNFTMHGNAIFATVGTTSFDDMIRELTSDRCLMIFHSQGFDRLVIQHGRGTYKPIEEMRCGIDIISFDYKDSIRGDLAEADLVISHAGAGSVMETLGLNKRLLVIVNEHLMDNHQTELAEEFAHENFLHWTTVKNLADVLRTLDWSTIRTYEPGCPKKFVTFMDNFLAI